MAKKLGNDYRLWLESSTPGTYNEIKGNQDLSISRDGSTIDIGTKGDWPYSPQAPGLKTVTISAAFLPDLPDANGYTRLKTQATSSTPTAFLIQIRKGGGSGADPGDVVFAGSVYCTQLNESMSQNDAVKASATLVLASAPTTDTLA